MKLKEVEEIISYRLNNPNNKSYISSLLDGKYDRLVQKVGEESIELVIEAKNKNKKRMIEESADLIFHLLILLQKNNIKITDIETELEKRRKK